MDSGHSMVVITMKDLTATSGADLTATSGAIVAATGKSATTASAVAKAMRTARSRPAVTVEVPPDRRYVPVTRRRDDRGSRQGVTLSDRRWKASGSFGEGPLW